MSKSRMHRSTVSQTTQKKAADTASHDAPDREWSASSSAMQDKESLGAIASQMEPLFGHSFANVRVHDDRAADDLTRMLGAHAFTIGSDVFVRGDEDLASPSGQRLFAHELTHVAQNERAGFTDATALFSESGDASESEAERAADTAMSGESVTLSAAPTGVVARSSKEEQHMMGDMGNITKFAKNLMSFDLDNMLDSSNPNKSVIKEMPGIGYGMDFISEALGRGKRGQGLGESLGGGAVSGLTSMLLDQKTAPGILQPLLGGMTTPNWANLAQSADPAKALKDSYSVGPASQLSDFAGAKGASTGMGLASSGLKVLSSMMGEADKSADFQVKDAAEYLDVGSKFASPAELAKSGVKEGMQGLYNTAQSTADWISTGSTGKFLQQGEDQLKGKTGPITQGYSMIANLVGSAATGDYSEMDRIGSMSAKGELGALPKLGSKLGDATYDISEVAGAGFGMIGDLIKGDTKNIENRRELMAVNNPLGKAVNGASDWLGDKMWNLFGSD